MHPLAELDHRFVWHPFTQMRDWLKREPIVIASGRGAVLRDIEGREFLDANSSIWTNLHGHNHPAINGAIQKQLKKIAHSSALGLANEPASLLAAGLVGAAAAGFSRAGKSAQPRLAKVFYSDNGSTALEVALKLAYEFARRKAGNKTARFLSLEGAYHGDTLGAVALGHIGLFHDRYKRLLFKTDKVMAPYCYRCRFNRAKPERADARSYRQCDWECVGKLEQKFQTQKKQGQPYAAFAFEPLIQGAAGMIPQPEGWLRRSTEIARGHGALLIADEVMTGFGRTGLGSSSRLNGRTQPAKAINPSPALFACHHEGVRPDFLALAKGMSGGYLPIAATLTTNAVFEAFLGEHSEFKAFFHGHSFTGNQLGAAAALASLDELQNPPSIAARASLERNLASQLDTLWSLPNVGDIRQVGLVAGIELVRRWHTREPFDLQERAGTRVCEVMARRGVLTRPIGNVVVLMPPYCTTPRQLSKMVAALREAISELFGE
jgi:adenosylmethionine-8-amino-7-oxononanoate aminotransferase